MNRLGIALIAASFGACDEPAENAPSQPAAAAVSVQAGVVAQALADVEEGQTATLIGTLEHLESAAPLSCMWKQLAGPKVALATPAALQTTLQAPEAAADYELVFELKVERGADEWSSQATLHVRADDDPPSAEAFAPARAECGESVAITGQGRSAEPQLLRFEWRQIGDGPRIALDGADSSQVSFVAPENSGGYTLQLEFSVTDGVNEPATAVAQVPIDCDARFSALAPGTTRELAAQAGVESTLPRGRWQVTGTLSAERAPAEQPATTLLRFAYGSDAAIVLAHTRSGATAQLRMFGQVRDAPASAWREPATSGSRALGEWPAEQPLGFEFDWDGHELSLHWGPPGERSAWPELPYGIAFPLSARPRAFAFEVSGGTARVEQLTVSGR